MKRFFLIIFIFTYNIGFGQSKWISSAYFDLVSNTSGVYTYYDSQGKIQETSFEKGAYELVYNIDYLIFDNVAISALTSYNKYAINSKTSSLKIGTGVKYFYVKDKFHNLSILYGYSIPFNKQVLREGHQIKIGQYFDITEFLGMRLLLGLSYNYDFLYLNEDILFGSTIEINKEPSLKTNSFGISLGLKF